MSDAAKFLPDGVFVARGVVASYLDPPPGAPCSMCRERCAPQDQPVVFCAKKQGPFKLCQWCLGRN